MSGGGSCFRLRLTGCTVEHEVSASPATPPQPWPSIRLLIKDDNGHSHVLQLASPPPPMPSSSFLCYGPIRIRAYSRSWLSWTPLGVASLYNHLHPSTAPPTSNGTLQGTLVFGSRLGGCMLKLAYTLDPCLWRYKCCIQEVRCTHTYYSTWLGKERLRLRINDATHDLGLFAPLHTHKVARDLEVIHDTDATLLASQRWRPGGEGVVGRVHFEPLKDGSLSIGVRSGGGGGGDDDGDADEITNVQWKQQDDDSSKNATLLISKHYVFVCLVVRERIVVSPAAEKVLTAVPAVDAYFSRPTDGNHVSVLVDGLQTFERYFHALMGARHSVNILAWELSLSFGLIRVDRCLQQRQQARPRTTAPDARWIQLDDVLLAKALEGVPIRIVVWRHELLTYVNRFLYLGEVTIEAEVNKLISRGHALGVSVKVFHTTTSSPLVDTPYADPYTSRGEASIVVVIVGNPRGLLSSHHEKLVLIDGECERHALAFVGGFDIARGRYDQPLHQIPLPYFEMKRHIGKEPRYTGPEVQPLLRRIRFLWHDVQIELRGPCVQQLYLHFAQRWRYAFLNSIATTQEPPPTKTLRCKWPLPGGGGGGGGPSPTDAATSFISRVELFRCWRGVTDVQALFEAHRQAIRRAKRTLFIEHQYPFHNWALTYEMCEALQRNPHLKVLIVTAVKTDLPSGLVGDMVNWSQDHITQHLLHIHSVAPSRVGVFGLCRQDEYRDRIKPIYVHSKLIVVDDEVLFTGSANMDDMSFFYSSELALFVFHPQVARDTRLRLASEHLGAECPDSWDEMFAEFHRIGENNYAALQKGNGEGLQGRPVLMAPKDRLDMLLRRVYYPSKISKALWKVGLDTEDWVQKLRAKL